jgi:hypothetical protein
MTETMALPTARLVGVFADILTSDTYDLDEDQVVAFLNEVHAALMASSTLWEDVFSPLVKMIVDLDPNGWDAFVIAVAKAVEDVYGGD